jgi:surface antigen
LAGLLAVAGCAGAPGLESGDFSTWQAVLVAPVPVIGHGNADALCTGSAAGLTPDGAFVQGWLPAFSAGAPGTDENDLMPLRLCDPAAAPAARDLVLTAALPDPAPAAAVAPAFSFSGLIRRVSHLQCVPYARAMSHIELAGDAFLWWAEAAGRYARGDAPSPGAVLSFRATAHMPLGHVAVVTQVINRRVILVTQANWVRGAITDDVSVQDISARNDWSQVQVQRSNGTGWGAPYPAYGFIYDEPMVAGTTEVAEAAGAGIAPEAPDRDLR